MNSKCVCVLWEQPSPPLTQLPAFVWQVWQVRHSATDFHFQWNAPIRMRGCDVLSRQIKLQADVAKTGKIIHKLTRRVVLYACVRNERRHNKLVSFLTQFAFVVDWSM